MKRKRRAGEDFLFVLCAGGGVLFAYFLVYVLRKSFTASTFDGLDFWGMDFKVVVSISQLIGYLLSKFCGIKIVSELKRHHRLPAIIIAGACAEGALILFALVPYPFNFFCLFFNGLALGCMWGFLFSYIEGRRLTDVLASFMGCSIVISSGAAKSFGLFVLDLSGDPFWMPAITGGIALPLLILMASVIDRLPDPTPEDKAHRTERVPLNGKQRIDLFRQYSFLLVPLLVVNILYTVLRDIKEDFQVDILQHTSLELTPLLFIRVNSVVTVLLLVIFGSMFLIKCHQRSLLLLKSLMMFGSLLVLTTSFFFDHLIGTPIVWLFFQSMGIYTAYLAFQTLFFDRFIAHFRITGNVGFFICLADFLGYFFTCIFLLAKTVVRFQGNWLEYYRSLSVSVSLICICCICIAYVGMVYKQKKLRSYMDV